MKFGHLSVFDEIYKTDYWNGGSGGGSTESETREYQEFLQEFLAIKSIQSVVDLGCGDWQFSKLIDWSEISYWGFDVAETVISKNSKEYSSKNIRFDVLRDYSQVPEADLLITKDVLQHLDRREVKRVIKEVFPKFKLILVTNCIPPMRTIFHNPAMFNRDIAIGDYTFFDIRKEPYGLQAEVIFEWKLNKMNMAKRSYSLAAGKNDSESNFAKWLKLPIRTAKTLVLGNDCEWKKQSMLIDNSL
jgi:SAM-dependent methyltransferase